MFRNIFLVVVFVVVVTLSSQYFPVKPLGQEQLNDNELGNKEWQVPPFLHGFFKHGFSKLILLIIYKKKIYKYTYLYT